MYKREHHIEIGKILSCINSGFFLQNECFFGGGTAISLLLNEYRESVDIDFLCSSRLGYKEIRRAFFDKNYSSVFSNHVEFAREPTIDRYGIRMWLKSGNTKIRLEIVSTDSEMSLQGYYDSRLMVPTLSKEDMFTQKILANSDRGNDKSTANRDIIDICMMAAAWGGIPTISFKKACKMYDTKSIVKSIDSALQRIGDESLLIANMKSMKMDPSLQDILEKSASNIQDQIHFLNVKVDNKNNEHR